MGGTFKTVEVIANVASGSVGKGAPDEIAQILAEHGLTANVRAPDHAQFEASLREAVDAAPDLLIVLAGDGTARAAAQLCGPKGPVIAPLPGGTMNMLPHAVYGVRPWQEALKLALDKGRPRPIGGGEIDGHSFLVAAIVGPPALWAPAREAARFGNPRLAWIKARLALRRAFTGRLRYSLDDGQREKAEALIFLTPLTSRALDNEEDFLEAGAMSQSNAIAALRLGLHMLRGDWRNDPDVEVERCKVARILSAHSIPALVDGELVRLRSLAEVRYTANVVRVLAIPAEAM